MWIPAFTLARLAEARMVKEHNQEAQVTRKQNNLNKPQHSFNSNLLCAGGKFSLLGI
jgi:hypothetical protein